MTSKRSAVRYSIERKSSYRSLKWVCIMEDQNQWLSRRQHPRIAWRFVVRFRITTTPEATWEVSTIKDISEGGCFFLSETPYEVGQALEIEIQFPLLKGYMRFTGEVRRCEADKNKLPVRYGISLKFLEMAEQKKKEFIDTLSFFLKKQQPHP